MRNSALLVVTFALGSAPLAAQEPVADLARLAFMTGCWTGLTTVRGGPGTIEERYTPPSSNVMLGTTRYTTAAGLTASFEFTLIRSDSGGTFLVPYPGGRESEHPFRLTRLAGDTAVFEAPEHDYPRRISYHRAADGALVARLDAGAADSAPRTWRMGPAACVQPRLGDVPAGPFVTRRDAPGGGTTELMVFETLHGLFLGLAVPMLLEADEPAPFGIGLLLGGPVGLMLSREYARAHQPSAGQARAIVWGGTWGGLSSLFLYEAFEDQPSASGTFGAMTAGLIGGTLFGGYVARNPISGGDGTLAIHSTIWGGWAGLALSLIADDGQEPFAGIVIGGYGGLLASTIAARSVELSSGRVWVITAAGLAGLVAGLGVDLLLQPDDASLALAVPLVTSIAGLAGGLAATRDYERDRVAMDGGPGGAGGGALLSVRDGRARFAIPMPQPALVPRDDGTRRTWVPGLRLSLLNLRH